MRNNKYLNFCAVAICLAISSMMTHIAFAQWVLPTNPGGSLIEDLDVATLNLTNWLLGFTLGISVLVLIWGGLNYVFSSGDTQKADLSKKIIYYALIGVFISGIAYAAVNIIVAEILAPAP
jgi:hypothetical protein